MVSGAAGHQPSASVLVIVLAVFVLAVMVVVVVVAGNGRGLVRQGGACGSGEDNEELKKTLIRGRLPDPWPRPHQQGRRTCTAVSKGGRLLPLRPQLLAHPCGCPAVPSLNAGLPRPMPWSWS